MEPLRLLNIEDNIDDSELLEMQLRRAGYQVQLTRVDDELEFKEFLCSEDWDIIISDFSLPKFNGFRILEIVSELNMDIPVIVVSGAVGEETAVEAMRKGAKDFILKGSQSRLIPAIKREVEEAGIRHDRRVAKIQLAKSEEFLQLTQDVARVGSWGWSVKEDILTWSDSMHKLCGYASKDIKYNFEGFLSLICDDDRMKFQHRIDRAVKLRGTFNVEFRILSKDGLIRWFETRGKVVGGDESPLMIVGIAIDISEHIQRQNELKLAKEKAEESDNLKSSFLANISHELRTPLNAIIGFSEILKEDEYGIDEVKQFSRVIHQNGNHLLDLINDIVDVAHIEAGQMPIIHRDFNLNELLVEVRNCFIPEEKINRLDCFEIVVPESIETPVLVNTDRTRLKQILLNLVRNAIKYTECGYVKFGYVIIDDYTLNFFVKDSGIGIPEDQLEVIFERFRQVDQGFSREFEGAGLGLSISKGLVDLLGGSIAVDSTSGKGSVLSFQLPCLRDHALRKKFKSGLLAVE